MTQLQITELSALAAFATWCVFYLLAPTRARIMRACRRARPVRAWRARRQRAREREQAVRDAYIAQLEREVFQTVHPSAPVTPSAYQVVLRGGRRYHLYADRAVYVGDAQ